MLQKYIKLGYCHTAFLGITSLFSRAVSFLFLPYFLSKLSLSEFGVWDFYQHFFSLGTLLVSSASGTALTRFYILYNDQPLKQHQIIGNAFRAVAVLVCILFIASPILFLLLYNSIPNAQFFFLSLSLISLFSFFSIILAYLRVSEQLIAYAAVFCSQSFMATLLTALGLHYELGITSFFYAYACSLLMFLPMFCKVMLKHWKYSWPLLKEQLSYSLPLLLYNFIYMGFFTLDRLFLKSALDYEFLGTYAILWRFGALYQFFSMSLMNAAPIIIFNAHKEKNGSELIQKLLTYACLTILLGGVISIYATHFALIQWFGKEYRLVAHDIPYFFTFLCMLEIARFMQTGFHLANKTTYIPIISFFCLPIQSILLYFSIKYSITGVCFANTCTFMAYATISYIVGYRIYPEHIIEYKKILVLIITFFCSILLIKPLVVQSILLLIAWSVVIWFIIISDKEKKWLLNRSTTGFMGAYSTVIVTQHCYSNNIAGKQIVILGPYPPPLGGISVHIKRVEHLLQQHNNVDCFDTIKRPYFFAHYLLNLFRFLYAKNPDLVYYHTPYSYRGIYEFITLVILQKIFSFNLILVEHDSHHIKHYVGLKQRIFSWCINTIEHVVFIGNTPYLSYISNNILPRKFSIESAFLPPDITERKKILRTYPKNLFTFINNHYPVILANAFQLRLAQGIDVYGYDMCLDLLQRLKKTYPSCGLIFALAQIGDEKYYEHMQDKAKKLSITKQQFIVHGQKELWPLYQYATLFVRPTLFDNYGISVAEALFFDVPAIASDVCVRPEKTTLFTPRDIEDFYDKVMYVLRPNKKEYEKRRQV